MQTSRSTFTAADRLHRRAEFVHVQRVGVRSQTAHFVLYAARTHDAPTVRLGTTVPRKLGNAVVRNKLKRRIRECFRLQLRSLFDLGTSLVVIGRNGAQSLTTSAVADELGNAAGQLRARLESRV